MPGDFCNHFSFVFHKRSLQKKILKTCRKTPVLVLLFNKVVVMQPDIRCFPVSFEKFFRTSFCRTSLNDCYYLMPLLPKKHSGKPLINSTNIVENINPELFFAPHCNMLKDIMKTFKKRLSKF